MAQLNENWKLDILFPDEFSNFIAEIYFQNDFVCLITQENGYEEMDIEIVTKKPSGNSWKFKLSDFEQAVKTAKQRLWDLRKTE